MISLATNIFNKLSDAHKLDLEHSVRAVDDSVVKLNEYIEKSLEDEEKVKFFVGNVPLSTLISDINHWDAFVDLLLKMYKYAKEDNASTTEVQFWVTSTLEPINVNIFFSVSNEDEVSDKLLTLKDTLIISNVFQVPSVNPKKTLVVGYDKEGNAWRINYI